MTRKLTLALPALAILAIALVDRPTAAQSALQVTFGGNGIQQLSYNGQVLEDLSQYSSDAFHIWHMKMTDLQGNVVSTGQYGWGESNNGRAWNAATHTWTYTFVWGSIELRFAHRGNVLDMHVTETNLPTSGVILDGATIYPFALHLPQLPAGFADSAYPQLAYNTTGPSVTVADYGSGEVVAVVPHAAKPLYSGFWPTGNGVAYYPLISGTTPDGLATFQPHNDRPVQPGQTQTFTVSLRFASSGTSPVALAQDAYADWARTWPPTLDWADRRPIGTAYLASSPPGPNITQPGGFPNNPRRFFNDSNPADFDIRTPGGLQALQARVLNQAADTVTNMRRLGAQGAITWDLEGEQYPQSTSYVCEPDNIAQIAPEMESLVTVPGSPYLGIKLDDAYFKTMTDAGFRVGLCIRPQHFTLNGDGTAQQVSLPDTAVAAELIRKMRYAHDRWGATLFYVDSTVEPDGAVLDASIFHQVARALPDSLIIPEESTPKHYAYTAPFKTFLFHGDLGTDPTVYAFYPHAFSANLINDVDPVKLAAAIPALTASVKAGDILMAHVEYWQANNPTIVAIYQAAGITLTPTSTTPPAPPPPAPTPPPPPPSTYPISLTYPTTGQAVSGVVEVAGSIPQSLDAAGSFLLVDGVEWGTQRVDSSPYLYRFDTSTLPIGQHTLQLWAHDINNDTLLSNQATVQITR